MPPSQKRPQSVFSGQLFVLAIGHKHGHRLSSIRDDKSPAATDPAKMSCHFVP